MPNHRIRFCDNNMADGASVTASSFLASFPVSNLTNNQRSLLWKSAGNFTVDSTNKNIYINDGTDKTVTLTEGNYTYSTLATHIETELNSASSNWTVSYDSASTFKFTLENSGSVTLRLSETTDAAWDMLGFTGTVDDTGTEFVADEQRNHTSEWFLIDLVAPHTPTFFAMMPQMDRILTLSATATVKLQANSVNDWASPPVNLTLTRHDQGIMRFFDDLADTTYRYWRVEIIDQLNTLGPEGIELAHMYLGDYTTITARNVRNGFKSRHMDVSTRQTSEGGASYFGVRPKYHEIDNVEIQYLPEADRIELKSMYERLGMTTPFYVSLDPTVCASADLQEFTKYVVFSSVPEWTHFKYDIHSVAMSFQEVS